MSADAVVLAGGLGTRLLPITGGLLPKALVPVLGRPFIDYKLRSLANMGVERAVLLIGEGADQIVEHVGDGRQLGIDVEYRLDGPTLLGTGGSIRAALDVLPERFWVTYGDSLVTASLDAGEQLCGQHDGLGVMTVLRNEDQWEPSNVDVLDGVVTEYRKSPPPGNFHWIDYGLILLRRSVFDAQPAGTAADLGDLIRALISQRALLALDVTERFWDVGTPDALRATEAHFRAVSMWESLQ